MGDLKLGKEGINLPNPPKYKMASRAIRFLITSLITTFSATDMVPDKTAKTIVFWLGVGLMVIQAFDIFLGIAQNGNGNSNNGSDPANNNR